MRQSYRVVGLLLIFCAAFGCAAPSPAPQSGRQASGATEGATGAGLKRLTAAMGFEPDLGPGPTQRGTVQFRALLRGGLTTVDNGGVRRPELAERVPTLENGLWKVMPDGRMETTWKLRPGAVWHDSAAFTAQDLLFSLTVVRDVPDFRSEEYGWIEGASAPDPHTLVVAWSRPFIGADALLSSSLSATPPAFPRHLLEQPFLEDSASLASLPYWRAGYVGIGPFKLRDWIEGSHAVLEANERYVLGRPRLDVVEVRFIDDPNTRLANVLSGAVDLTMGFGLSVEQGILMRDQWRDGTAAFEVVDNWLAIFPQLLNPTPPIVGDLRLRKALMHGLDRQEMVDTLQAAVVPVAHSFLSPNQPSYREIETGVVRYEYDARRAAQMIEGLGYARGSGGVFRDASDHKIEIEIRAVAGTEVIAKTAAAAADYWQRLGIPTSLTIIPSARVNDQEYVATFPAFFVRNNPNDVRTLPDYHSQRTRTPENSYRAPGFGNVSRYANPQFDALIDRYFGTIPVEERIQVLGQIAQHISDQLNVMGLFYNPMVELIGNRVMNVTTGRASTGLIVWNAHEWDVKR